MGRKAIQLETIPIKVFKEIVNDPYEQQRKSFIRELHNLHRDNENNIISNVKYCNKRIELESKIRELTNQHIMDLKKVQQEFLNKKNNPLKKLEEENNNILNKGENKMAKEETKKDLPKRARADSIAAVIEKVLMMKSIKNIDKAIEKIKEFKPGINEKNVKNQINTIIRLVEKGEKARWKNYKFDKEAYLLEKVE